MSLGRRREMVDRKHPNLPIVRQCALVGVSRSSLYYRPKATSEENLSLMREMDRQYLETPFYGSRRMKAWLERRGIAVNRKRVQRLMRAMGMRTIYRRPSQSSKMVLASEHGGGPEPPRDPCASSSYGRAVRLKAKHRQ